MVDILDIPLELSSREIINCLLFLHLISQDQLAMPINKDILELAKNLWRTLAALSWPDLRGQISGIKFLQRHLSTFFIHLVAGLLFLKIAHKN